MRYTPGIVHLAPPTPFANHREWRHFLKKLAAVAPPLLAGAESIGVRPLDFFARQWLSAACQTNTDTRSRAIR
jgi:hypothetical protein